MRADALLLTTSYDMLAVLTNSLARTSFTTGFDSPAVHSFPPVSKSLLTGPGVLACVLYFPHIPNSCIASNSRAQTISLDHALKITKINKQMSKSMPNHNSQITHGDPHSEYAWPAPGRWEAS